MQIRQYHVLENQQRATTAEKCAKKRDARAKLSFCLSKPIAFLPFSLSSYHNVLAKALSSLLLLTFSFLVKRRNWEMALFWVLFTELLAKCSKLENRRLNFYFDLV